VTRYIETRREAFGVEPICRVLGLAASSYYARRSRKPSARALADRELVGRIQQARSGHRAAYGVRRTWRELNRRGVLVGRDRVARLMRAEGLAGVQRGRPRATTTPTRRAGAVAGDLVQRRFQARAPDQLWVGDITYLPTAQRFAYLAFILDVYSRRVVGWQIARRLHSQLVLDALEMAVTQRRPVPGLIAHSDRGAQYTSLAYTARLRQLGIARSCGSTGDAYDNAMAEAFVATFKTELVAGRRFESYEQAEHETLRWIGFYNHERLHEQLGGRPPAEYETMTGHG
jgi:putative transposase